MGIASFAVALVQYLFDGMSFNRDLMIFSIISAFVIIVSRKIFRRKSDQIISSEDDVNQY
jgi:membrane protein implicated in regulation of membrane protease activity